ncbi:MAG: AraC family transcriptional regulator [Candidatus Aminicenantes bacterium]
MRRDDLVDCVIQFVLKCTDEELGVLSVTKLAREFSISESFLSRQFKRSKHFTIGKYIFRERMFRAALLLQKSKYATLKSLAETIGFYDYDYFVRMFKQFYGVSPSQYRKCKKSVRDKFKIQVNPGNPV